MAKFIKKIKIDLLYKFFTCFFCFIFSFSYLNLSIFAQDADLNNIQDNSSSLDDLGVLKGRVSKVPSGTKLKIIVETPIDEETSKLGDEFTARTTEDIAVDKNVVVPGGSTVVGQITEINLAKRLHKAGSVRIEFKSLTTPDGRQIPIVASVLTRSGLVKGKYTPKRALIAGATIVGPAVAGLGAGLATEGSAVGAGIGATLGVLAGIALFAFQRGNKVDIKAGNEFYIELTEDVLVPEKAEKINEEEIESKSIKDFTESEEESQVNENKEKIEQVEPGSEIKAQPIEK